MKKSTFIIPENGEPPVLCFCLVLALPIYFPLSFIFHWSLRYKTLIFSSFRILFYNFSLRFWSYYIELYFFIFTQYKLYLWCWHNNKFWHILLRIPSNKSLHFFYQEFTSPNKLQIWIWKLPNLPRPIPAAEILQFVFTGISCSALMSIKSLGKD